MAVRFIVLAAVCVMFSAAPNASRAQSDQQELKLVTPPLSIFRDQIRPSADALPVPSGFSREQVLHGVGDMHRESCLADERTVVGRGKTKTHLGGVKIQVPRSDASRAIQFLHDMQEQSAGEIQPARGSAASGSGIGAWLRADSWTRAAVA